MPNFFGLLAPAGASKYIVAKVNADAKAVLARADIAQQLIADAPCLGGGTPEQFGTFIRERRATLAQLIKVANIRPE
jgi:tripartite-type tricarboxylate transporter receptor subunit TctC